MFLKIVINQKTTREDLDLMLADIYCAIARNLRQRAERNKRQDKR